MTCAPRAVIQLIPGAPPLVNGVGDYAFTIARALRSGWGIESIFLVCNPVWRGPETIDGFRLIALRTRHSKDLVHALRSIEPAEGASLPVVLQLSPYGYDINGCPFWLFDGLRQWRQRNPRRHRLLTYFHELYATSWPWRRAFWVSAFQRSCTRALARLSDTAVTSTNRYEESLARWDPRKAGLITTLPIVSNVGEPDEVKGLHDRRRRMVVWGSEGSKRAVYGQFRRCVSDAVRTLGVEVIVDVGPPSPCTPSELAGVPVEMLGVVPLALISSILSDTLMGVFAYDPSHLGKSTLFAAFCAHGVPALVLPTHSTRTQKEDGLSKGGNYLCASAAAPTEPLAMDLLEGISKAARAWYAPHGAHAHARAFARALGTLYG